MYKLFFWLGRKQFFRSSALLTEVSLIVLKCFLVLYFSVAFLILGFGLFEGMEEMDLDALEQVNKYIILYFAFELGMRFFLQKMPTTNIKPLLIQNISRKKIINYFVGKHVFGVFNLIQLFFFIPFTYTLIINKGETINALGWALAMYSFIFCFHFVITLINNNKKFFFGLILIFAVVAALQYFNIVNLILFGEWFFGFFYAYPLLSILPFLLAITLGYYTRLFYLQNLYLDFIVSRKREIVTNSELKWLDKFGKYTPFLKNDLRLIARNKRARSTVIMSFVFLFYGFLFISNQNIYMGADFPVLLSGFFITGSFLLTFGQYVPGWDSAHYPFMMSRNIIYRNYLESKWMLIVFGTILSIALCSFYLLFYDWQVYAIFVAIGIFNIGINSYLVLLGGAYLKSFVDLSSNKSIMGDTKSFNFRVLLASLPQIILPFLFFYLGKMFYGLEGGIASLVIVGMLGLLLKKQVFLAIEKIYKNEKHDTLQAYKK